MIAPTQIQKPKNWQDFETLCKKLWGEIWNCSDTIQQHGRNGQNQHGVDIYGIPQGQSAYFGIQCKGKDDYTHRQLTEKEIDTEIAKAKTFEPALKRLIFATTANRDTQIETYIRKRNIESIAVGDFEIYLSSWEDIIDLLIERRDTYNWYVNNCQYKNSTNVDVTIEGKAVYTIHPQYYRTTKKYKYIPKDNLSILMSRLRTNYLGHRIKRTDYRWANVHIQVENIGSTVISDYKLYLKFSKEGVAKTSDLIQYPSYLGMNDTIKTALWEHISNEREVYKYSNCNDLEIIPTEKNLVQTDSRSFKIGIKPEDNASEIKMYWDFKSRDYNKQGIIIIKVEPVYTNREEIIEVDTQEACKDEEIVIEPKIEKQE